MKEFKSAMAGLGISKDAMAGLGISKDEGELNDLFSAVDKDNSNSIEWDEFLDLVHKLNWK